MKYLSENRLYDFVWHDSVFSLIGYENDTLKIKAEFLNIVKTSPYNPEESDMQIRDAVITFEGFRVAKVITTAATQIILDEYDEFSGKEGDSALEETLMVLRGGLTVLDFGIHDSGYHFFSALDEKSRMVDVRFMFYNAVATWDEFSGVAWYEKKRIR